MNLSDFCQPFYSGAKATSGLKGVVAQNGIAEYFMRTAIGEDRANSELVYTEDQFRKWFKGDRTPKAELWAVIADTLDNQIAETQFSRALSEKINDNALPALFRKFGIVLNAREMPDKYAFSAALTKQFIAIAKRNGECANIISASYRDYMEVAEFPDYVKNAQDKYAKMKTLLYTSEERPFDEFFVCNTISTEPTRMFRRISEKNAIENVTAAKLLQKSKYTLLVGMGGIGKSMMMRHLFLEAISHYSSTGIFPILVTLREFNAGNADLMDMVVDSVHRFDMSFSAVHAHNIMSEGKALLLLDGLDEVRFDEIDSFKAQLDALVDRYPNNQYIMSTRRFSSFVELSRFKMLFMMPFTHSQALELIDKLEYCPEEPKLKQQFRDKLEHEYFHTHLEFVTNPLLLTLMLMNYRRFSDVPEKKYLFYEQAYETLLRHHDSDKLAYKRVFRSVTDPSDFTLVFREFCAKSYRKGDYKFNRAQFDDYFSKLKSVERVDKDLMKPDNFLYDICHSACLMYEEGQYYHFLHRSFQEYFYADYYSRQDDTTLRKLGLTIDQKERTPFDENTAFDMLYDKEPEKVEHFILLPFLEKIYEDDVERNKYWKFLQYGFGSWIYTLFDDDIIEKHGLDKIKRNYFPVVGDDCYTQSNILSLIFRLCNIWDGFEIKADLSKYRYSDLIIDNLYAQLDEDDDDETVHISYIPGEIIERMVSKEGSQLAIQLAKDENDKPIAIGHVYNFKFSYGLEKPEKYKELVALFEGEKVAPKRIYNTVKKYYNNLKAKFANSNEIDDDDF